MKKKTQTMLCYLAVIEENSRINFDEDVLRLNLPIVDPANRENTIQSNCFAVIKKSVRLREGDKSILGIVNGKKNVHSNQI